MAGREAEQPITSDCKDSFKVCASERSWARGLLLFLCVNVIAVRIVLGFRGVGVMTSHESGEQCMVLLLQGGHEWGR